MEASPYRRVADRSCEIGTGLSHIVSGSGFELSRSVHRLPGFVVCVQSYKKDSPSSGLFRVKVYN
jgi:hypothetical protein